MSDHQHQQHLLKSWPDAFSAIVNCMKTSEFRVNDRNYHQGDTLVLQEWDPGAEGGDGGYTGRKIAVNVTWIDYGPLYGIPTGGCVMSIEPRDMAAEQPMDRRRLADPQ